MLLKKYAFYFCLVLLVSFSTIYKGAECFQGCAKRFCQKLAGEERAKCCLIRNLTAGKERGAQGGYQLVPSIYWNLFVTKNAWRAISNEPHPVFSSLPITFLKTATQKEDSALMQDKMVPQVLVHQLFGELVSKASRDKNFKREDSPEYDVGQWVCMGEKDRRKTFWSSSEGKYDSTKQHKLRNFQGIVQTYVEEIENNYDKKKFKITDTEEYAQKLGYKTTEPGALTTLSFLEGYNANVFNVELSLSQKDQLRSKYKTSHYSEMIRYSGSLPYDIFMLHTRAKGNNMPIKFGLVLENAMEGVTLAHFRALASLLNFWDPREELCLVRLPKGAEVVMSYGLVGPQRTYFMSEDYINLMNTWFLFTDRYEDFTPLRKNYLYPNNDAFMGGALQLQVHAVSEPCDVLTYDLFAEKDWEGTPKKDRFYVRRKTPFEINKIIMSKMSSLHRKMSRPKNLTKGAQTIFNNALRKYSKLHSINKRWQGYYRGLSDDQRKNSYIWYDPKRIYENGTLHLTDEKYDKQAFSLERFLCQRVPKGGDKPILSTQACKKIQHLLQKPVCDCKDE